ncbi:MAG: hypothetical protein JWQ87_4600 [Candidatus Sulfotelmatobacter sp.]|nr:hypothetical protein [Candidatus Sulfotelmatobacter sp.]
MHVHYPVMLTLADAQICYAVYRGADLVGHVGRA